MPDLLALTLTLQPLPGAADAPAPRWWGRAVHALWLDVVAQMDPALARAIHDGSGLRPYTLSTLMGRFSQRPHRRGRNLSAAHPPLLEAHVRLVEGGGCARAQSEQHLHVNNQIASKGAFSGV